MKVGLLAAVMLTATDEPSFAQAPATALPKVFSDGDGAKQERVSNVNQVRYLEMYLAAPNPETGKIVVACYNSSVLPSKIPASKDTCPQNLVKGLDKIFF